MSAPIRVLVVDDSAFARKVLREALSQAGDIEVVGTARDGLDALEKIAELQPDVVTLDLVMPGLDGVGVLKALGGPRPPRVIVVSMADAHSELAIAAMQAGAVELVHKPTALATVRLYELTDELVQKIRIAAGAQSPSVEVPMTTSGETWVAGRGATAAAATCAPSASTEGLCAPAAMRIFCTSSSVSS